MLSGGAAKANGNSNCTVPFTDSVTYTDLGIVFTDTVTSITPSKVPGTVCNLELTGLKYPFPQKQFDIDYNPTPLVGMNDLVEYTINKIGTVNGAPVKVWFDEVSLAFGGIAGVGTKVEKFVYATEADFNANTNSIAYLLNTTGANIRTPLPNMYSHLWIRDVVTPGTGAIDNVINDFRDVPGPLPVLGAGAAFGFSRKLRGRIKAARTA